jgi:hypothetical protein
MTYFRLLTCVVLMLMTAFPAQARRYIIVLSPMQNRTALEQDIKEVAGFLLTKTKSGDSALIIDGQLVQTIATFNIPDKPAYENPKAKMQINSTAFLALKRFSDNPMAIPEYAVSGAIKTPQILEFIGKNYGSFEDTDIIFIGSPIYADTLNDDWTMKGNRWANDGYFNVTPDKSVFSLAGRKNLLKGASVRWKYDSSWISSEPYKYQVTRMWTLYIEGHGTELATFTGDFPTLWNGTVNRSKATPHNFVRDMTQKLEIGIIQPESAERQPIFERGISTTPPPLSELRQAKGVEIGISWDCQSCDIDLHVRPHNGADVLNFNKKRTIEGFYHKDFTQSPQTEGGFETVTLTSAVDLQDTLVAINWYGGKAKGVNGSIRLSIQDKTYELPFHIKASQGNAGGGQEATLQSGVPANINWLVIAPKTILGLR